MNEYLAQQNRLASPHLRDLGVGLPKGYPPLLQLISASLSEEEGSIVLPPGMAEPDPQQWDIWNNLLRHNQKLALETLEELMQREDWPVPPDLSSLPKWAAQLVVQCLQELSLGTD